MQKLFKRFFYYGGLAIATSVALIGQDDLSSLNLTPTQIAQYSSMDEATQRALIKKLKSEKTKKSASDLSLKEDNISKADVINEDSRVVSNELGEDVMDGDSDEMGDTMYMDGDFEDSDDPIYMGKSMKFGKSGKFGKLLRKNDREDEKSDDSMVLRRRADGSFVMVKKKPDLTEDEAEEKLELYGYDIFDKDNLFKPSIQLPIPIDYILGPGDTIVVHLYGKLESSNTLTVTREGNVMLSGVGDINVSGLTFIEAKKLLMHQISQKLIGVDASVTMGELRSIRVFIMGEVSEPGSYAVSSLATITNALFSCGGINKTGSLRHVQLKRAGKLVGEMDLYDLLLQGDNSSDLRLQPGDVILVPPLEKTASVKGSVIRPAIYELDGETTVDSLVKLSGGLKPDAATRKSQLYRINQETGLRTILTLNLASDDLSLKVHNGDQLQINSILDKVYDRVSLKGAVSRPKDLKWFDGIRISDLIPSVDYLDTDADLLYVLIQRKDLINGKITVLSTRVDKVFENINSPYNLTLSPQDTVVVLSQIEFDRYEPISDIVDKLKQQGESDVVSDTVEIQGNVSFPGEYPYCEQMRLVDLLRAAHGYAEMTDRSYAILKHTDNQTGIIRVESVSLPKSFNEAGTAKDVLIHKGDELIVFDLYSDRSEVIDPLLKELNKQATQVDLPAIVKITGNVRHPGRYPLSEGMSVLDLLNAAGGFTSGAYTVEAELTHNDIRYGRSFGVTHENIDLVSALKGNVVSDKALKPYDHLMIRPIPEWAEEINVKILGEVYFPGVYKVKKGETLLQLVERAGGFTDQADPGGSIFVRKSLRVKEQYQLDRLRDKLKSNLAAASFEVSKSKDAKGAEYTTLLLDQLESAEAVGRMVIDLPELLRHFDNRDELILKDGDVLMIPQPQQEVMVLGEVLLPTSHLYQNGLDFEDYINLSGGTSSRADIKRIYVIKSNGSVVPVESRSRWFRSTVKIEPGDSIVVPFDVDYISPLPLWKEVTSIVYNLAVSAAAVASF